MTKRIFDILFSTCLIVLLSPLLLVLSILVSIDSKGSILFGQMRVGKNEVPFKLLKFRTMYLGAERNGLLTVGARDSRITPVGFHLRKYKVDELPQLWNVLVGEMSMVGPRPEVPNFTALYNNDQKLVLTIKPGITDYASLLYFNENELLAKSTNPEKTYIEIVMPAKLKLNLEYVNKNSMVGDLKIIWATIKRMVR